MVRCLGPQKFRQKYKGQYCMDEKNLVMEFMNGKMDGLTKETSKMI